MAAPHCNFEQKQPITTTLRNICQSYPQDTVLRELLQNADDAGATEVKSPFPLTINLANHSVMMIRTILSRRIQVAISCHLAVRMIQLLIYNRSNMFSIRIPIQAHIYTQSCKTTMAPLCSHVIMPSLPIKTSPPSHQWATLLRRVLRIRATLAELTRNVQRTDPLTTGKFGQGFNSVYHMTDGPWILSRSLLLFLDPHHRWSKDIGNAGGPAWDFVEDHASEEITSHVRAFAAFRVKCGQELQETIIRKFHPLPSANLSVWLRSTRTNRQMAQVYLCGLQDKRLLARLKISQSRSRTLSSFLKDSARIWNQEVCCFSSISAKSQSE